MASKRRIRRKSCDGKIKFEDESAAVAAAIAYRRNLGHWMNTYKCRFCGKWHIGHPRGSGKI